VENIRSRSRGQALLTLVTSPDLYYVEPSSPSTVILLYSFHQNNALLGITEVRPDHFYILGSNFSASPVPSLGNG
jgi:hypothetical protein